MSESGSECCGHHEIFRDVATWGWCNVVFTIVVAGGKIKVASAGHHSAQETASRPWGVDMCECELGRLRAVDHYSSCVDGRLTG
jgi:hypothetical protein